VNAEDTVDAFLAAIEKKDVDAALELMHEEAVYDNVPIGVVVGRAAIRQTLEPFLSGASAVEWRVLRQLSSDGLVFNERVDRFEMEGRWVEIHVAGVWEVDEGLITLWRDYFDLAMFTKELQAGRPNG
jgi:limonene-1,2-epoxide hydrolase